jgi:hypothetical protein
MMNKLTYTCRVDVVASQRNIIIIEQPRRRARPVFDGEWLGEVPGGKTGRNVECRHTTAR